MAFGGFDQNASQPMSEINTTPLVDVMLVLLIIFIVCAPLMTQTVHVNLPKTAGQASQEKPDIITVNIDAQGVLRWNDEVVTDERLQQYMAGIATKQPAPELRLAADKEVRYERVAQVMGFAKTAGVNKMGFVMLSGDTPAAAR